MSSPQFLYNYPLQILEDPSPQTGTTILFKTRYNSLFELLPAQATFKRTYNNIFNDIAQKQTTNINIQLSVVLVALLIICIVATLLALSVITKADSTMLLFGHLTRGEVEKEIDNCNSFLEVFYQDSYMIKLKQRQRLSDVSLSNDEQSYRQPSATRPALRSANNSEMELRDASASPSMARFSVNRIEYMEKELHLRTEGELILSQTEQDN